MALERFFRSYVDIMFKYIYYITKKTYKYNFSFSVKSMVRVYSWVEDMILKNDRLVFMVYNQIEYTRTRGSLAIEIVKTNSKVL